MKKIIFFLLSLIAVASYSQTTTEISNILAGQYVTSTGNITTQNLVPAGTATAGSAVSLTLANQSTATIHVSGTYTGALSLQYSTDLGTTWVTFTNAAQLVLETTGVPAATISSASVGAWTTDVSGLTNIRVTGLAAMTGTAVVSIRAVWAAQQVGINQALPAGTNIIGALSANQSTNIAQMNGVAVAMGAGATGTGVQRVILATDNLPTAAASADALANPTISQLGSDQMTFNGTSWDRQRSVLSLSTTTGDTGAKTATGNGATQTNVGSKGIQLVLNMGAVTGTTPTFVLKIQGSVDGGTNWIDIPGATTASLTATGLYGITLYPAIATTAGTTTSGTIATAPQVIPRTWRVVWTIGGTTPSFTITSITFHYTD